MRIGLISDTHSWIDPKTISLLNDCDEIWHAGDIGDFNVVTELEKISNFKAVYGNIDDASIRLRFKENLVFAIEGKKILITHIAGPFGFYTPRVQELIKVNKPDILVCGHSHICKVAFDKKHQLLYINPGASGNHGFHQVKTILRFTILKDKIFDMEVVELGKRGEKS